MTSLSEKQYRNTINWFAMDWIVLTTGIMMLSVAILGTILDINPTTAKTGAPTDAPIVAAENFSPL